MEQHKQWHCLICDVGFSDKKTLISHTKTTHKNYHAALDKIFESVPPFATVPKEPERQGIFKGGHLVYAEHALQHSYISRGSSRD